LGTAEDRDDQIAFEVNLDRQALKETTAAATGDPLSASVISIPVCDTTLVHISRISDEEENRFQMGVTVIGRELDRHEGGTAWKWGSKEIHFRKGVRLQLVNVGSTFVIKSRGELGYPICRICGQSVSPLSSEQQRLNFSEKHKEWCGQPPQGVAFHADLSVDALTLPDCENRAEAFSMAEAIRFAAAGVLDMHIEDLQVLVLGKPDSDALDAMLYDPMPGGSGLLEQICERFPDVIDAARTFAAQCPSLCRNSCIDCFQIYRNAFYHEHLDRHLMLERFDAWGNRLERLHPIPAKKPAADPGPGKTPVNVAERKLKNMLRAADFPEGVWQESHPLPRPLKSTRPDLTYNDPDDATRKIFIYLDGLSEHIHGNPQTMERDRQIREELKGQGHDVLTITAADLDDREAMKRHLSRLARLLIGRDAAKKVTQEAGDWFAARTSAKTGMVDAMPFKIVDPDAKDRFKSCVPIFSLKAAAGSFSEGQVPEPEGWASFETRRKFTTDMFVAQVVGKSMEPRIPDGSWCLFTRQVAGSRNGRILIVQHRDIADPETGGSYTIKEYRRPPQDVGEENALSGTIQLMPANNDFEPIIIENDLDEIRVVGELLDVIG
ncbi:MAG: DUF1998 domain-containing protein, partial [Planctomycetes bacterium]|nr:DUF1998 domain-containing protein [Planctomycetota bacterium]